MRLLPFAALAVFVATLAVAASGDDLKPEDLYKQAAPSVVVLNVKGKDGASRLGSGFLAIKEGLAVTSWHVVRDAASVKARFSDGEEFDVSGLVDKDESRDLALIRVKVAARPMLPLVTDPIKAGQRCYVIGSPKGLDFSITDGLVSAERTVNKVKCVQYTAATSPGNSGGPVIDSLGRVIAVVTFFLRDGQNLNFGVSAAYALGLDSTLPTVPWRDVEGNTIEAASDENLDADIARVLLATFNANAAFNWVDLNVMRKDKGFRKGVPSEFHATRQELLDQANRIKAASTDDQLRYRVASALAQSSITMADGMNLIANSIVAAQNAGGWAPVPNDLANRGRASISRSRASESLWQDLNMLATKSSKFANLLTTDIREAVLRIDSVPKLDVLPAGARNPTTLIDVKKDGLADKLGLEPDDTIVSVNEQKVSSISGFKAELRKQAGQAVVITVIRKGKTKDLKAKVPDDPGK